MTKIAVLSLFLESATLPQCLIRWIAEAQPTRASYTETTLGCEGRARAWASRLAQQTLLADIRPLAALRPDQLDGNLALELLVQHGLGDALEIGMIDYADRCADTDSRRKSMRSCYRMSHSACWAA